MNESREGLIIVYKLKVFIDGWKYKLNKKKERKKNFIEGQEPSYVSYLGLFLWPVPLCLMERQVKGEYQALTLWQAPFEFRLKLTVSQG